MKVTFDHKLPIAKNIVSFYFRPDKHVRYTAGQFIEMTLPHASPDERGQKRWFTLSSSPSEELLTITTKFPKGQTSTFKQTLQKLKKRQIVQMSDPMGDFVLPKDKTIPLNFIAGGIGITPMHSMIKWLVDTGEKRNISLLYAANTLDEMAFTELFDEYGLDVTVVLSNPPKEWTGETDRLNGSKVLELVPRQKNTLYYISGPEPMVESLVNELTDLGISPKNLVGDYFPNYSKNL